MTTVATSYGQLRGLTEDGIQVFRGIPFAAPPVGELRWRAPTPVSPWSGIRDAFEFGSCAIQSTLAGDVGTLIGIATHEVNEDCLYLNVWTPSCDGNQRPVMVWIHGGGNTVGSGSQPRVNGKFLAQSGDVVVVTLNYRLGALGFLYAPELDACGNQALLDQTAALRWVKQEIGAFGGDPSNVTVFGQSAGGFDIAQLMAMPAAEGCFDKAVPMSGSLTRPVTAERAHASAEQLAARFGGFGKLCEVDAYSILQAQGEVSNARWAPTLDGTVVVADAEDVLTEGRFTRDMPLMIGHTRDESTLFTAFNPRFQNMSRPALVDELRRNFDEQAEEVVACYEQERTSAALPTSPSDIQAATATDSMFRIPAIRTSEAHGSHTDRVWMYRFDFESPAHEGRLGACHSLDIPFVWGTYGIAAMERFCGTGSQIASLSHELMASYLAFARSGNPQTEMIDKWPKYEIDSRATMCFGPNTRVVERPLDSTRQLWMSR